MPGQPTPRVSLVLPTVALLEAASRSRGELERELGLAVPEGWPEFPQTIPFSLGVLRDKPDEADWWTYLFVDTTAGTLVGSGGLKGPPIDGVAEIGYEIAPALRGHGYATEAATLLIDRAAAGGATQIGAHTLAAENPSVGVLRKLGFEIVGTIDDPDAGAIWHWRRDARP
ncbi:GNAT family protein [Aeromicrobium sp. NPDC092404]|uniref:GNAT family N-acetyltransferase n=1 Tax=Aeromicrobium sp. NPDC092404 TaxID=3154976 RepID=UPI003417096A